jgi:predicted metal-dependent hydrolase
MTAALQIDGLLFKVRRSTRRKTLGITVDRGGDLLVDAPAALPARRIEAAVRSRLLWVHSKLARKRQLLQEREAARYVPGEGHLYLGRRHRLLLVDGARDEPLRLAHGRFELARRERGRGGEIFRGWYVGRGREWLLQRIEELAPRVGAEPKRVEIRDLGFRWGSCSRGVVYFNWQVMQLPPRLIEYVVAHELVHVRVHHHTPAFWRLLRRVLPDAEERKVALAELHTRR